MELFLTYGDIFRNLNQKSYEIHFQILQPPYSLQKNWQGSITVSFLKFPPSPEVVHRVPCRNKENCFREISGPMEKDESLLAIQ